MKSFILANDNEINEIMENEQYTKFLLQLSATWCEPCVLVTPQVQQFIESIDDENAVYMYCDVDKCPTIKAYMNVQGIPAFIISTFF